MRMCHWRANASASSMPACSARVRTKPRIASRWATVAWRTALLLKRMKSLASAEKREMIERLGLNGRETQLAGELCQLVQNLLCAAIAFRRQLLNPRAANGNQREFRRNKEAVCQHQQDDCQQRQRRTNRELLSEQRHDRGGLDSA